jgi:hypothetical protein
LAFHYSGSVDPHLLDGSGVEQLGRELRQQRPDLQGIGGIIGEDLDVGINFSFRRMPMFKRSIRLSCST